MRRHVLPTLDDLDLDLDAREIAEAAARRSGLSLEEWVASAMAVHGGQSGQSAKPERRRAGDDLDRIIARMMETSRRKSERNDDRPGAGPTQSPIGRDEPSRTAIALESMASWIEHAEERLTETARISADQQDRMAAVLSQALAALKERLDTVERQVTSERAQPARIEFPVESAVKALAPISETLTGLRSDMSRLTERLEQPAGLAAAPALEGIRADIEHLRSAMGGLATQDEIAALDGAVRSLAKDIEQGRPNRDLLTLAQSVASVHRQVQSLSNDLADGVHRRLGAEIDELKSRIDSAARSGIDRPVIDFLASQIIDLRQELAQRAEPQQIERLSGEVDHLSRQIAELRANQVGRGDFAALKSSLEDVCAALSRTVAVQEASTVPEQLESLSRRLETLAARPEAAPANLDPITEQLALLTERMASVTDHRLEQTDTLTALIEQLSSKVEALSPSPSQEPLLKRFDRLEEELRQVGQQADTSSVELLLRSLSEKLEQPAPLSALDALEQRVASLADSLAPTSTEPLQKVFDEVTGHLKKLQDETSDIAERAARAALRDASSNAPAAEDIDALKQGFVELKALHSRSDKKTQETLRAVRDALETLVARYPEPVSGARPSLPHQGGSPSPGQSLGGDTPSADRLEAAVRRLHAATLSQIAEVSVASSEIGSVAVPPNPSAGAEASRSASASFAAQDADLTNVRTSFIAAARRAAQATPDRPSPADDPSMARSEPEDEQPADVPVLSAPSLLQRIRRSLDARRRPLLLGLALLTLTAGTLQILSVDRNAPSPAPGAEQPVAEASAPETTGSSLLAPAATKDEAQLFQPTSLTTASPVPSKFIVDPATIGDLPAQLPAALKQAAHSGDAASIYEIASRASEGRGLAHDPILAAHLYERAAQAGFAPAQERLAMLYEKGVGVLRDVKLAATWYERAAQGGNIRAMHNLATLLASGASGKPDYPAALRWYTEAAEAGLRDSQFNLGVLFTRGIGTRPDLAQAFKWFALAAAQGDGEAANKRDEVASRLGAGDLAAARTSVERWQPRIIDPSANAGPSAFQDQTAALNPADGKKS